MAEHDNIALYRRFIEEVERPETVDELLAPGIELPTLEPNAEPTAAGLKQLRQAFLAGFPDLRATIDEIFTAGDWVAARLTWTGTNTGELFGQPPTGKPMSITELEIVRFQDGQIIDLRNAFDGETLAAQLSS
jgi:predicted ester cyclase